MTACAQAAAARLLLAGARAFFYRWRMKRLSFLVLAVSVFATVASARIGETPEQCEARYGKPVESKPEVMKYAKAGMVLTVTFFDGLADGIVVEKEQHDFFNEPLFLSTTEIQTLLQANAGNQAWEETGVWTWQTHDGQRKAAGLWGCRRLVVGTKGYMERAKAKEEAEEKANLKGF